MHLLGCWLVIVDELRLGMLSEVGARKRVVRMASVDGLNANDLLAPAVDQLGLVDHGPVTIHPPVDPLPHGLV